MTTVTKKELAYRIAERTGQKKVAVKRIIQEFISEIVEELAQGHRLEFREFGVFEIKTRAARKARNPRTGRNVSVPAKSVVHFKAGRALKERVQASTPVEAAEESVSPSPSEPPPRSSGGDGRTHLAEA